MAFVISLQGCHGVGKSTLLREVEKCRPEISCHVEGLEKLEERKTRSNLRMDIEREFYEIQKWYIEFQRRRFSSFPTNGMVILDRGPEEMDFYILHHIRLLGKTWNVERELANELRTLRSYRSNRILYLRANEEVIRQRVNADSHKRPTFERWLKFWQPYVEAYFLAHPATRCLDTTHMRREDVLEWTLGWLEEGHLF